MKKLIVSRDKIGDILNHLKKRNQIFLIIFCLILLPSILVFFIDDYSPDLEYTVFYWQVAISLIMSVFCSFLFLYDFINVLIKKWIAIIFCGITFVTVFLFSLGSQNVIIDQSINPDELLGRYSFYGTTSIKFLWIVSSEGNSFVGDYQIARFVKEPFKAELDTEKCLIKFPEKFGGDAYYQKDKNTQKIVIIFDKIEEKFEKQEN